MGVFFSFCTTLFYSFLKNDRGSQTQHQGEIWLNTEIRGTQNDSLIRSRFSLKRYIYISTVQGGDVHLCCTTFILLLSIYYSSVKRDDSVLTCGQNFPPLLFHPFPTQSLLSPGICLMRRTKSNVAVQVSLTVRVCGLSSRLQLLHECWQTF